jgi:hypothetical protein
MYARRSPPILGQRAREPLDAADKILENRRVPVHFEAIFAGMGGNEPNVVQKGPQKAISSSITERPMLLTARFPKT